LPIIYFKKTLESLSGIEWAMRDSNARPLVQEVKGMSEDFPLEHVLEIMNLLLDRQTRDALRFVSKPTLYRTERKKAQGCE